MDTFSSLGSNIQAVMVTDGSAIPNPGNMSLGILLLTKTGKIIKQKYRRAGRGTNNEAETRSFLEGLELALENGITRLSCFSDSKLLVDQATGSCNINKPELKALHVTIKEVSKKFEHLEIMHHSRETPAGILADAVSRGIKFDEEKIVWQQLPLTKNRTQTSFQSEEVKPKFQ